MNPGDKVLVKDPLNGNHAVRLVRKFARGMWLAEGPQGMRAYWPREFIR